MTVWRLCKQQYAASALDGRGGLHTSGRRHTRGHPIVYTSSSAALAALEMLVHVEPLTAPGDLRMLAIELPGDISTEFVERFELPTGWDSVPAPEELQAVGTSWLTSRRSAALVVPSAIVPVERNVLLDPRHPDVGRVRIRSEEPFSFDPRLRSAL